MAKKVDLRFDGERLVVGPQDQGLLTKESIKMAGISQNDQCSFCHNNVESVSHLIASCQTLLADGHYTARHNKISKHLHWRACKELGTEVEDKTWEHVPKPL